MLLFLLRLHLQTKQLGLRDYHPRMRGLGNKWRNWRRLLEKRRQMREAPETVRFDRIPAAELDTTLTTLAASGYQPVILIEPSEVPQFQTRFAAHSALAALDWPPLAHLRSSNIKIYDPADRLAFLAGRPRLTEIVP